MLKALRQSGRMRAGGRFAIVASRYNQEFVDGMLAAARAELERVHAAEVQIVRVPGAFEIPVAAAELAGSAGPPYGAVICLGVILRGETTHADHIGQAVIHALAQIQVHHRVPVIHEVLLLESEQQARDRCLDPRHNRGTEAARTAIEMARVLGEIRAQEAARSQREREEWLAKAKRRAHRRRNHDDEIPF